MGLKQKTISGFLWTSAGTLGNGFVSFLVTIILARILEPRDFALIALLTIFVAVSNVIIDSGFSQAIIRDDNPSQKDLSSVFFFNIIISFALYFILFFCSPFIANYFDAPELTSLSRVLFFVIVFNSFTIIQNATLNRDLNFAAVSKSSVIGAFLAGLISVVMAFTNCGIWAIVANMVLLPFFRSIFLWIQSKWKPLFYFSFLSIKKYFNFSAFLMIQGLIDAIVTNLNSVFIGKVYTKNDLGYYSQGGKINDYVVNPLSSVIEKVTYPILSKIKDDPEKLKNGYRNIISIMMFVCVPIIFFVIFFSDSIIVSFFGDKWLEAGIYLKISTIGGLFYPFHKICTNIVMVKGHTKQMLYMAIIKQTVRFVTILMLLKSGVLALAYGFMLSGIFGSLLYIYLGMKYINYNIGEFLKDVYKIILFSAIPSIILSLLFTGMNNGWLKMFIGISFISAIYLILQYLFDKKNIYGIIDIIKQIRK